MTRVVFSYFLFLQVLLHASGLKLATSLTDSASPKKSNGIKIVLASHFKYGKVREKFWQTLKDSGFTKYEQIIVLLAADNTPGMYTSYKEHPDTKGGNLTWTIDDGTSPYVERHRTKKGSKYETVKDSNFDKVTYLHTPFNSFDLTSFAAIANNLDHPKIKADGYLMLHDTMRIHPEFKELFDQLTVAKNEIKMSPRPNSNIMLVGSDAFRKMGHNFDTPLSKEEGLCIEVGGLGIRGVQPAEKFANKITYQENRTMKGDVDYYGTGRPRRVFYLPALGVSKYIFWDNKGDITADVSTNDIVHCSETVTFGGKR